GSIETAENLIRPVAATLRIVAEAVTADPAFFKTEASRNLLHSALISAEQLDGLYVSFEDGYHRVVTRIDADRRRAWTGVPAEANWHSSHVDEFSSGPSRRRYRTFFDTWPHEIGGFDEASDFDVRKLPHYSRAKETAALAIADPSINPDTGFPVMSLGYPVIRTGAYLGFVGANITLDKLSQFLRSHQVSPNSLTLIVDEVDRIIAHPIPEKSVRKVGDKLALRTLTESDDAGIRAALQARGDGVRGTFRFVEPASGEEMIASMVPFPASFQRPWRVVTVTPMDDFVGPLNATNRIIVFLICFLIGFELVFIHHLARVVA